MSDSDPCLNSTNVACYNTAVSGENIIVGLVLNTMIGILCYFGFVLWRGVFTVYYAREVLPGIKRRPPRQKLGGHWQLWSWLIPTVHLSDKQLLETAGLDAWVAVRIIMFGVALFFPILVGGIGILLPVYYTANANHEITTTNGNTSSTTKYDTAFVSMSMSNLPSGSPLFWIPFTFLFLFVFYTCYLVVFFYEEHIAVRQTIYATQQADLAVMTSKAKGFQHKKDKATTTTKEEQQQFKDALEEQPKSTTTTTTTTTTPLSARSISLTRKDDAGQTAPNIAPHALQDITFSTSLSSSEAPSSTQLLQPSPFAAATTTGAYSTSSFNSVGSRSSKAVGCLAIGPDLHTSNGFDELELEGTTADPAAQEDISTDSLATIKEEENNNSDDGGSTVEIDTEQQQAEEGTTTNNNNGLPRVSFAEQTKDDATTTTTTTERPASLQAAHKLELASKTLGRSDKRKNLPKLTEIATEDLGFNPLLYPSPPIHHDIAPHTVHPSTGQYTVFVLDQSLSRYSVEGKGFGLVAGMRMGRMTSLKATQETLDKNQMWGFHMIPGSAAKRKGAAATKASNAVDAALAATTTATASDADATTTDTQGNGGSNAAAATTTTTMESTTLRKRNTTTAAVTDLEAGVVIPSTTDDGGGNGGESNAAPTKGSLVRLFSKGVAPLVRPLGGLGTVAEVPLSAGMPWGKSSINKDIHSGDNSKLEIETAMRMRLLQSTFTRLFGDEFDTVIPIYQTKPVDRLLMKCYKVQAQAERVNLALIKARQAIDEGKAVAPYFSKSFSLVPYGWFLMSKNPVKLQEQLNKLLEREKLLQEEIKATRAAILAGTPCRSFIATFHTAKAAAMAANININPVNYRAFQVVKGADADNINWVTLQRGWWERNIRFLITLFPIILMMLFPLGAFTGAFSQLDAALCGDGSSGGSATGTWFCSDDMWATLLRSLITGMLPSILMTIWQTVVLPIYLYSCVIAESSCYSLTQVENRLASLFFYWNVFNFFIGALFGGTITNGLQTAINDPSQIWDILADAVTNSSNFFINYVMYKFLGMGTFRLFFPGAFITMFICKWCRVMPYPQTKRDKLWETPPRNCRFSRDISIIVMAIYICSLSYALVAPFILPFAFGYFLLAYYIWRYQMLYVFQPAYNSEGAMWRFFAHRIVACLSLMVVFTGATFIVKSAWWQAVISIPVLCAFLIYFDKYLTQRYDAVFFDTPITILENAPRVHLDPVLYTPPPLRDEGQGWFVEWGKAWRYWGVPRYSL